MKKLTAESSIQNRQPIFETISPYLNKLNNCLEIGSGTGQHAVYFAADLPHLIWQTSDRRENLETIQAWIDDSRLPNVVSPFALDVLTDPLPDQTYSAIYSANTVHIMGKQAVVALFDVVGKLLQNEGVFLLYGPFNYNGKYTSDSNQRFDMWLASQNPESCIKDFEWIEQLAQQQSLVLFNDHEMPANNRLLAWQKVENK